jgi:hypothetical protein
MAVIITDLFPATVKVTPRDHQGELLPNHTFELGSARVVVTDNEVLVITDSPAGPILALQMPYSPGAYSKGEKPHLPSYIGTDTGQVLEFFRDTSCGCGSRLRGFNPYAHIVARG